MLRALRHDIEHPIDEAFWNVLVEKIAHRVDEINRGLSAKQGLMKSERQCAYFFETLFVAGYTHGLQAARHRFGITMLAAGADFRAADDRIPCAFSPLYSRFCSHNRQSSEVESALRFNFADFIPELFPKVVSGDANQPVERLIFIPRDFFSSAHNVA